ncbi:MAG: hypothetical protein DLM72_07770 [Candidatus Nitrosopolaris wilkensis]|nr:MAG: hypothetical protein DLM72_07770 [Candidatus Nitrosopolaris wilkensis]
MTPNKILSLFGKNNLLFSGIVGILITMIASSLLLSITMERHQSSARCPNGYHMSPSGVCEQVIQPPSELPRCPNGYHRSPSLVCEQVTPSSPYQNPTSPYQNQTSPYQQQQPLQQQQQLVQLYNPNQVVACLNNVLTDSIIKASTLHNTPGIVPGINSTFIDNATKTLDNCIVPSSTITR